MEGTFNLVCSLFGYSSCGAMSTFEAILLAALIVFVFAVIFNAIAYAINEA